LRSSAAGHIQARTIDPKPERLSRPDQFLTGHSGAPMTHPFVAVSTQPPCKSQPACHRRRRRQFRRGDFEMATRLHALRPTRLFAPIALLVAVAGLVSPAGALTKWSITLTGLGGEVSIDDLIIGPTGQNGIAAGSSGIVSVTTNNPAGLGPHTQANAGATMTGPSANGTSQSQNSLEASWPNPLPKGNTVTITFIDDDSAILPSMVSGKFDYVNAASVQIPAGAYTVSGGPTTVTPEASTLSIVGPGALGMLGCAWRQRKRARVGQSA